MRIDDIKKEMLKIRKMTETAKFYEEVRILYAEYCKLNILLSGNPNYDVDYDLLNYDPGNCYTYALGLDCPDIFYQKFQEFKRHYVNLDIGFISNPSDIRSLATCSKSEFKDKLMSDLKDDLNALKVEYFDSDFNKRNIHGGYKIAIFYNIDFMFKDFHVIRENEDKVWSQKSGYGSYITTLSNPQDSSYRLIKVLEIKKPSLKQEKTVF